MLTRRPLAVAVAGILGGLAFIFVFPWADPCGVIKESTHACISGYGSWQRNLWNVLFFVILTATSCVSGLIAPHGRYIGGIAGAIAALVIAHFGVHAMYGLDYEQVNWRLPGTVMAAAIYMAIAGTAGALGALVAQFIGRTGNRGNVV